VYLERLRILGEPAEVENTHIFNINYKFFWYPYDSSQANKKMTKDANDTMRSHLNMQAKTSLEGEMDKDQSI